MAVNEQIVTGRKFRKLVDEATKLWQRISFWTKASDVEFDDGFTAETKMGAINGITDSLVSTSSNVAASAKALSQLNNNLMFITDNGAIKSLDVREDGVYITYVPTSGADSVTKKLGNSGITITTTVLGIGSNGGTNINMKVVDNNGKVLYDNWTYNNVTSSTLKYVI